MCNVLPQQHSGSLVDAAALCFIYSLQEQGAQKLHELPYVCMVRRSNCFHHRNLYNIIATFFSVQLSSAAEFVYTSQLTSLLPPTRPLLHIA